MGSRPACEVICFDMTIDPICGMTVDEVSVPRAERDGPAFRFCGDHCRQKFLPTPHTATHEQKPQGKAIYLCPMHPEVQEEHPGDCPKCGMALEPKTVTGDMLFFAFLYNMLGIPVAAGVLYPFIGLLLSPIISGAAMSLSSVSVISNALRLRKVKL